MLATQTTNVSRMQPWSCTSTVALNRASVRCFTSLMIEAFVCSIEKHLKIDLRSGLPMTLLTSVRPSSSFQMPLFQSDPPLAVRSRLLRSEVIPTTSLRLKFLKSAVFRLSQDSIRQSILVRLPYGSLRILIHRRPDSVSPLCHHHSLNQHKRLHRMLIVLDVRLTPSLPREVR